ncbi:hypothetical protein OGAPHI_003369 [Ogataea philodendri]|uniref:Uncharacterized protein n=1 Tax=Ogataea philodendri TaxID=1378263 RepID=A0A9P8T612_9ASCO|nr:uncharacterized protein OGAPHI_003369 [Ogataea philodendri]KAH3666919.1 hypothetical protein OGAPHI_003369 [Ogataea philodendri]
MINDRLLSLEAARCTTTYTMETITSGFLVWLRWASRKSRNDAYPWDLATLDSGNSCLTAENSTIEFETIPSTTDLSLISSIFSSSGQFSMMSSGMCSKSTSLRTSFRSTKYVLNKLADLDSDLSR